ncbi:MAG: TPR repeat-containing protein [Candidatus Magnetoglobus multicellularis str. Araruama]|uniref:TPR repeat-containing protein n=1 Tax=Candidatus Magnetoglobus multicellularis str. Araruama TaxID=890399 RepID=A0A1V1PD90_9BACT|nr:MAG: TPR repeat-containing protein [Candidatus Magnetoglobus multicellularis str. Araruama]
MHMTDNHQKASLLFEQALLLTDQNQANEAIRYYQEIISIQPDHAIAYNNLGILFNQQKDYQKAETCFKKATQLDKTYANAWFNWGNLLKETKDCDHAIEKYSQAIKNKPLFAEAYNNMGECFGALDQFHKAIEAYETAIKINSQLVGSYYNLGNLHYKKYHYQRAREYYQQCIVLQPDYKDAHYHLGFASLILGDYTNGFKEYEWRLKRSPFTGHFLKQPVWDGKAGSEKIVFVYCEQGFGDNLHFCRYLTVMAKNVKRIIFGCRDEQARLFKTISGVDQVIIQGEKVPRHDYHCSLLSLPFLLQTNPDTIPCNIPYVFPKSLPSHSDLIHTIDHHAADMVRVGIVWGGNPNNKNDAIRSISLKELAQLFSISGICWFSFQKGPQVKDILDYASQLVDLSEYFDDFYDTAIGLSQMDLLITVDTSVAHLAGALGIPFWLMIPSQPDWRWLLDRSDSPWYPSCQIFRKNVHDSDWQPVLKQIKASLSKMMSQIIHPETQALFENGLQQYHQNNYDRARIAFQKVLSVNPIVWGAEFNLSQLFARQGDIPTSIFYGCRASRRHICEYITWKHLGKQYHKCADKKNAVQCLKNAQQSSDIFVHAIGCFDGCTGYHIHTRSFFDALAKYVPVHKSEMQLDDFDQSIAYMNNEIVPHNKDVFNIAIRSIHQLDILSSCPGIKIGYVVWESTCIPDDWLDSLANADILWTPSQWGKQILINHGIHKDTIQVIPEGVNEQIFKMDGPGLKSLNAFNAYKFLYVGKFETRKATAELIVTFDYAFKDNNNVRLVLCTSTHKKDFDINAFIQSLNIRHPEKIIRVGPFVSNSELAALYRSCDAFVIPTRGEGWGLPIIEAMACGLPTIVTGYSGLTEFVSKENAYLIDFKMETIQSPLGWLIESTTTDYGQWAEPDFMQLSDIMQYIYQHPEEAKARGRLASHDIHSRWTWDHAARKAVDALKYLRKS